ncbi:MAG: 4-hydroxyphenylacetate 3-hydroxylase N-terminal domain-containing protein [Terrimesophilobacter sp.]
MTEPISPTGPYVDKVVDALAKSDEPHLMTGSQYLESLNDGRRVIDANGEEVDNVATHPATSAAAKTFASVMDLQFDPATRDIVTYTDSDGKRKSRGWQVPTTRADLYVKREQIGVTTLKTLGMFGRPPDYGPGMALGFLAIIDRVEKEDPERAENIRRFVDMNGEYNLLSTDLIADSQSNRSVQRNERPGTLRVVDDRPDGVVLRGSKVAGSSGTLTHFFTLSTTLGEGLGPDAAIWGGIPVNLPGVSLLMREPTINAPVSKADHPLNAQGEEMDQMIVFDDAFLPREYVFSLRNLELLGSYLDSCVYVLWHIMSRLAYRAEIFAGTAQVITEILGTNKIPGVRRAVAEITMYAQTLRAYSVAAIAESETWNGVEVPNPGLVSAGRLYSITNYNRIVYLLQDLCGQGLISRWPEKIWDHPEFGPKLEAFLPGNGVTAQEKNRFFNFVWDMTSSGNASRLGLFENVNATPPSFIAELVYQHVDRSKSASFVREFAGIPDADLPS